jgi:PAS domain S-box-containing protein
MTHIVQGYKKGIMLILPTFALLAAGLIGAVAELYREQGDGGGLLLILGAAALIALISYLLYRKTIYPSYRSLEDANLELRLKQEELLDTKDDLFIKFLGIYDVNYSLNSPRLFSERLKEAADIIARVMEADACCIFLYDAKQDDLDLSAASGAKSEAVGEVHIPLGDGIEGWVGRRLKPLLLKEFRSDSRYCEISGFSLVEYSSVYCLPLYVYSSGVLVGVMEVLYRKARNVSDEEINFFTTLSGILSTTILNERMQTELKKMNTELEQWVTEKTEEFKASEERYRILVENASEAIFLLAENGDIVFANEQAVSMSGFSKYDLLHKNAYELMAEPEQLREGIKDVQRGSGSVRYGSLRKSGRTEVPVALSAVKLILMGKRFIQLVVRDISSQDRLEKLLAIKDREIAELKERLAGKK